MSPSPRLVTQEEFTRLGETLLGNLWDASQAGYESRWLGESSPQRGRGDLLLLGWDGAQGPRARLALWRPADGGDCLFFLYARAAGLSGAEAAEILEGAKAFGREKGMKEWTGPMAFSTWHPYRFISRMGEAPFFPGEQKMPERDCADFMAAGFAPVGEYQSSLVDWDESIKIALALGVDRALGQVQTEILGADQLPRMLPELHRLSLDIFKDNFAYAPISLEDFLALSGDGGKAEPLLVTASVGGRPAGFAYSYAIGPYGVPGKPPRPAAVLKTLGVHPDFRRFGLGYGLSYLVHKAWHERGVPVILHAYMKTDNRSRAMSAHFGQAVRDYALLKGTL